MSGLNIYYIFPHLSHNTNKRYVKVLGILLVPMVNKKIPYLHYLINHEDVFILRNVYNLKSFKPVLLNTEMMSVKLSQLFYY